MNTFPHVVKNRRITYLLFSIFLYGGTILPLRAQDMRNRIDISGTWQFTLDSTAAGIGNKGYLNDLSETVILPGTTDENEKGNKNTVPTTAHLSRRYTYTGQAWYRKEINIPESFSDKHVTLFLERTKETKVWIDDQYTGSSTNILTPQIFQIPRNLKPGKHTLTIMVNNDQRVFPQETRGSHAWTDHTQTNWNGIVGKMYLEAKPKNHIADIQVYPDFRTKNISVRITIHSTGEEKATVRLNAEAWNTRHKHRVKEKKYSTTLHKGINDIELTYHLGKEALSWSEFNPALYRLAATLSVNKEQDHYETDFGLREFKTDKTQFTINGVKTFLRGKHDACVFPLTGYPAMTTQEWQRLFKTAKSYGINHYRFHTWTPPEAAFEAADIEGIYLQPELPVWGTILADNAPLLSYMETTAREITKTYGNHPSFVMMALGNELFGDSATMSRIVKNLQQGDSRHLYASGSNNFLGNKGQTGEEDFFVTCRTKQSADSVYTHNVRASFSFADEFEGGYINGMEPSTRRTYTQAISASTVPVIGHETGQFQVYPDFSEIDKYTGVLRPVNLEIFKQKLAANNMLGQAGDFHLASGKLAAICYREDIEMALRTPNFGGFQMLDLQDFPGQGTALVGLLDAFMDNKGIISPAEFSQFCNRVVPLAMFDKYCWNNDETFSSTIKISDYSEKLTEEQKVKVSLSDASGKIITSTQWDIRLQTGELNTVGDFRTSLETIKKASALTLSISIEGTPYRNRYTIWVYPKTLPRQNPDIKICHKIDRNLFDLLKEGEKVLLFPDPEDIKKVSVGGMFTPDYWNFSMFKSISESLNRAVSPGTLSILTDPGHPLFSDFPTGFHTDWQWWSILKNSRPVILTRLKDFTPLVQVIDNIERNHKLGLIFEFSAGKGKLLVCSADLEKIRDKPEGIQLYNSILKYMNSPEFSPRTRISETELFDLFNSEIKSSETKGVKNITSYE